MVSDLHCPFCGGWLFSEETVPRRCERYMRCARCQTGLVLWHNPSRRRHRQISRFVLRHWSLYYPKA